MPKRVGHLKDKMLHTALEIINRQSELLALHGIETDDGQQEKAEEQFRKDVEGRC